MEQRILMIGNDLPYMNTDRVLLQQTGSRVYTSDKKEAIDELMREIKPDVVFINWQKHGKDSSELYNYLLNNLLYATVPIVYTLYEDDTYMVNRSRTAMKEDRYITSDNLLDAMKTALEPAPVNPPRKRVSIANPSFQNIATTIKH